MQPQSFQHLPSFHSSHIPANHILLFSTFLELPDEATTVFNFPLYIQLIMFFSCLLCWRLVSSLYFLFFCVNKHYNKSLLLQVHEEVVLLPREKWANADFTTVPCSELSFTFRRGNKPQCYIRSGS
jgi:hypothetical protein